MEKNLVQHKVDEKILRYKLEVYQKTILDFVCDNPTNTKASNKDEEVEIGPNEITQKGEVQIEEP